MSIPVALTQLAEAIERYRFAYLLTSSGAGAPHAVAVRPSFRDGMLVIDEPGRRTRANAGERPAVALVWPPPDEAGYSLIVDGQAAVDGDGLRVVPARAVLHRPALAGMGGKADEVDRAGVVGVAAASATGRCGADCVELELGRDIGSAADSRAAGQPVSDPGQQPPGQ